MYLYGIFIENKFGLGNGAVARDTFIQLVKNAGQGEVKRLKSDPSISAYDAPTFRILADPVFVLAPNCINKETVDVGILVQVRTWRCDLRTGQYCMITGYSKRGYGTVELQPVESHGDAWVAYHHKHVPCPGVKTGLVQEPGRYNCG